MEIDIFKNNSHRWEWLKFQLRLRGYTLSQLDREIGVGPGTVLKVKIQNYPKAEKLIADKLETKPRLIWPERYDLSGRPIRHSSRYPRQENTKNNRSRQRLNRGRV